MEAFDTPARQAIYPHLIDRTVMMSAVAFGMLVVVFAMAAQFVGSLYLLMAILFVMGICNSSYMISIQSSLQMLVPDRKRGRVMGFYGMTWSIMPLGGMQAGALASIITAPFAIALGGLAVAAFAIGPALLNSNVRNLGAQVQPIEPVAATIEQRTAPSAPTTADG